MRQLAVEPQVASELEQAHWWVGLGPTSPRSGSGLLVGGLDLQAAGLWLSWGWCPPTSG